MSATDDQPAELVISAPEPYAAPLAYATRARTTLGVLTQLVAEADAHLVLSAPFVQARELLEHGILAEAIDSALGRGIHVELMTTKANLANAAFRDLVSKHRDRVRLYYPAFPDAEVSYLGSHAKFCIRDTSAAYIGSANLTAPALGLPTSARKSPYHFEMGVLVRGDAAKQVHLFWRYMVQLSLFASFDLP